MRKAGYCSQCGVNVWLDGDGGCSSGHGPEFVSGQYDVDEQPTNAPAVVSKDGLFARVAGAFSKKELTSAQRELRDAQTEYDQRLREANKELKSVTKESSKALKAAERDLKAAHAHGTDWLGAYESVTLYEHKLKTSHGTIDLESELATASVESAGAIVETRRSTLTRMAAGGLLTAPFALLGVVAGGMMKKKGTFDSRELYLIIESPSVASMVPCKPDDGARVRQLAAAINSASLGAAARAARRSELVAGVVQRLDAVRKHGANAVAECSDRLGAVQADSSRLDVARLAAEQEAAGQATASAG